MSMGFNLQKNKPKTPTSTQNKKRIVWLDYARAFAILAVVLCHSTEMMYGFGYEAVQTTSLASQAVQFSLFSIGRMGVPIFLFLSGFLLLDREYTGGGCLKFWKTKWLGLLAVTEAWIIIYDIILGLTSEQPITLPGVIENLLFIQPIGMGHMWYMPMILGLYLLLPIVANGLRRLDDARLLVFPLLVVYLISFITPVANVFLQVGGEDPVGIGIVQGFTGGVYGCYLLLGYCVKKGLFQDAPLILMAVLFCVSFCAIVCLQIFAYANGLAAPLWYDSGLLLIAATCLFVLISRSRFIRESGIIYALSYYSFALYLIHFPVMMAIKGPLLELGIPSHAIQVIIMSVAVLVASLITAIAIAQIPKVGKRLLYLK